MCINGSLITNAEFMSSFSFHRPHKHYDPPEDVTDKINSICKSITGLTSVSEIPLNIPEVKFKVLNACFQEFRHSVPNSLLSTMITVGKKNR
jgi:large subunit ribosomal protein L50